MTTSATDTLMSTPAAASAVHTTAKMVKLVPKIARPATLAAERPICDAYLANQLRRLHRYAGAGNVHGVQATLDHMLRAPACRLVAAATANDKLKSQKRSDKNVLKVIERLNPWVGTDEPVRFTFIEKDGNGNLRPIQVFGLENKSLQYLVMPALKAMIIPELKPNQFCVVGGRDKAMLAVRDAILAGYVFACELDIRHFYNCIDKEWIVQNLLVLPHQVTRRVILPNHYVFTYPSSSLAKSTGGNQKPEDNDLLVSALLSANGYPSDVRSGLSQGAATSPIIAEWLIAIILDDLPAGIVIVYADDILVLGRTKQEAQVLANVLGARLKAHPAGPFLLHAANVVKLQKGVNFLGYRVSLVNGEPSFEPKVAKRKAFREEHVVLLNAISSAPDGAKVKWAKRAKTHLREFCGGYKLWDEPAAFAFKNDEDSTIAKLVGGLAVVI